MITSDYHECLQAVNDGGKDEGEMIGRFRLRIRDSCSCFDDHNEKEDEDEDEDEDDDVDAVRRRTTHTSSCRCFKAITLYSHSSTKVDEVGKQLWKSSFIMADFLVQLHLQGQLEQRFVFEFGTGVGFLPVVLHLLEHNGACCTDRDEEVLAVARRNVFTNSNLYVHDDLERKRTELRCLDWRHGPNSIGHFFLEELRRHVGIMYIASDCIYDDELTTLLFETAAQMMTCEDVLYISLDKRYNFEAESMALVAHAFENFSAIVAGDKSFVNGTVTFEGAILDLNSIPMYLCNYKRSSSMELWEVKIRNIQSLPPPPPTKRRRRNAIRPNSEEAEALAEVGVHYNMSRLMDNTSNSGNDNIKIIEEGKDRAS